MALLVVYAASRFLQVLPLVPMLAVVVLHVVPPALFALIHGARLYRLRGILVFMATCLTVANVFENLGVRTGFPFGRYYFTEVMGLKFLVVPVFLGLAYVGMAYLSWTLARVILRDTQTVLSRSHFIAIPLLASGIMVSWDLAMDPVWSTIVRAWIWQQGGSYFGVPLSNFLGWFLTVYVFYQLFALYLSSRANAMEPGATNTPASYWNLPVLFYALSAAGNLLLLIPQPGPSVVSDPAGAQWKVSSITAACAVMSIFTMGSFALLAWLRRPGSAAPTRVVKSPRPGIGKSHVNWRSSVASQGRFLQRRPAMKKWFLLTTILVGSLPGTAVAQTKADLIGTWRLVSGTDTTEKGQVADAYGKDPTGFLTYTTEGRVTAIISFGGRKPLSVNDYISAPAEERAAAYATFLAYAGAYSLDGQKVIHHVEACSLQNRVGTDLIRTIVSLQNGRLTLRTAPFFKAGRTVTTELVWERLK